MADVHDRKTRSYNMSRIKSKDTKPELLVRKFLFSNGFRYRLHDKRLPGKPDIVLPKYKTVIFVNGCFWHGHKNCKFASIPKTRTDWWIKKIERNIVNEKINLSLLKKQRWKVIFIYQCQLKGKNIESTFKKVLHELRSTHKNNIHQESI